MQGTRHKARQINPPAPGPRFVCCRSRLEIPERAECRKREVCALRFALCALRVRVVSELEIGKCPTVDCALESCLYQHQPALLALALAPYKSKFPVKPKPQTQPAIGVLSFLLLVVGVRRPWLPLPRSQKPGSKFHKTQDSRCKMLLAWLRATPLVSSLEFHPPPRGCPS